MKKLFIAAALAVVAMSAHANETFYMNNNDGGRIELYDNQLTTRLSSMPFYSECNATDYIAKAWSANGDTMYGCMTFNGDDTINVYWPAMRQVKTYVLNNFTKTQYMLNLLNRAKANQQTTGL